MNIQLLKDVFGWGITLWLFGYILGIIFFFFVPQPLIGWVILPLGVAFALWILIKKISGNSIKYYFLIAIFWTLIAIFFDYFFLVKIFKPTDGYYKLDVYVYYVLTFILPIVTGYRKSLPSK